MRRRVLAVLIPLALLLVACSGTAGAPAWTFGPTNSSAVEAPSTTVTPPVASTLAPTVAPSVAPSAAPSAEPSAEPQSGDIPIVMTDAMRFVPEPITVKAGEEVTFMVKNEGLIVHEFFVGSEDEQVDHAAEMASGAMSHGHDNALSLEGGESGSLTMTFAAAGSLLIGCHEPGHYDAGMKATLTVVD